MLQTLRKRCGRLNTQFGLHQCKPARVSLIPSDCCPKHPVSKHTFDCALRRMDHADQLSGHGIRATISTAQAQLGYAKKWLHARPPARTAQLP